MTKYRPGPQFECGLLASSRFVPWLWSARWTTTKPEWHGHNILTLSYHQMHQHNEKWFKNHKVSHPLATLKLNSFLILFTREERFWKRRCSFIDTASISKSEDHFIRLLSFQICSSKIKGLKSERKKRKRTLFPWLSCTSRSTFCCKLMTSASAWAISSRSDLVFTTS